MLATRRRSCLSGSALGLALVGLVGLCSLPAQAQGRRSLTRCGTPDPPAATLELLEQRSREFEAAGGMLGFVPVSVLVHVHVLMDGPEVTHGNIPDSAIQAQIAQLNIAFAPRNIQFTLSSTTRTNNAAWFHLNKDSPEEAAAKAELHRGDRATLNLYTARLPVDAPSGYVGYATSPADEAAHPLLDGVVVDFRSLPGGSLTGFNEGDTGVHETGHWLGLLHTFQGGCTEPNDHVEDTPACLVTYDCPAEGTDTCPALPGVDPIHNFMSYTNDPCMYEFTNGQGTRMAVQWAQYRQVTQAPPPCGKACGQNQPCDLQCRRPDGSATTCAGWGCCLGNCGGNPSCPGGSGGLAPFCSDGCGPNRPCDKLCRMPDGSCSTCGQYGCCEGNCGGGGGCQGGSGGLAPYCSDGCGPNRPCDKKCRLADETCSTCGAYGNCQQFSPGDGLKPESGEAQAACR